MDRMLALGLYRTDGWDVSTYRLFGWRRYIGLEQAAMEWGPPDSQKTHEALPDFDATEQAWQKADEEGVHFDTWLREFVAPDHPSAAPFARFMQESVENAVFFCENYGVGSNRWNPWLPLLNVLSQGILLSDEDAENEPRLVFRLRGVSEYVETYPVSLRYELWQIVYHYLVREAPGHRRAKSRDTIIDYIRHDSEWVADYADFLTKKALRDKVLSPLMQFGLIGSTPSGYFNLTTPDDFVKHIDYHEKQINDALRMLDAARAMMDANSDRS
ncbi:MAG: hypothetical protein O3A46_07270 [Candidatus Poribacteria bacterium]|nr:hypothetical protein [Candidatus Poribacteria bacterium]